MFIANVRFTVAVSGAGIAGAACGCALSRAARLTGQVIAVDGGFTTVRPLVK